MAAPGIIAADGDIAIRRMRDHTDEYERVVAWRNRPHVREWWDPDQPPLTLAGAVEELRPDTEDGAPTTACIIELAGAPAGFVQFYPWAAYQKELDEMHVTVPDGAWGLDIFIGEPALLGRGIGSRAVRLVCDHLLSQPAATAVAFGTEVANARAQAAYVRAGMRPAERYLDLDVRGGRRVESILMIREREG